MHITKRSSSKDLALIARTRDLALLEEKARTSALALMQAREALAISAPTPPLVVAFQDRIHVLPGIARVATPATPVKVSAQVTPTVQPRTPVLPPAYASPPPGAAPPSGSQPPDPQPIAAPTAAVGPATAVNAAPDPLRPYANIPRQTARKSAPAPSSPASPLTPLSPDYDLDCSPPSPSDCDCDEGDEDTEDSDKERAWYIEQLEFTETRRVSLVRMMENITNDPEGKQVLEDTLLNNLDKRKRLRACLARLMHGVTDLA